MPLVDHFHPPLSERRSWHSFHNTWATWLAGQLNETLPEWYFAEPNVQFGIEIDVAAFEEASSTGVGSATWPTPPVSTVPYPRVTDVVEVAVYGREGGPSLVGAVELVSPAHKDRPGHRDAFVAKCHGLLQLGVGLVVVDVVTSRAANLHEALLRALDAEPTASSGLYATAYHPVAREEGPSLDVWEEPLRVGDALPTVPLWLKGLGCVPLDLESAYTSALKQLRVA